MSHHRLAPVRCSGSRPRADGSGRLLSVESENLNLSLPMMTLSDRQPRGFRLSGCLLAALLAGTALCAQTSSLLRLQSITAGGGEPVEFNFMDQGSGATGYVVEVSAAVGPDASWSPDGEAQIIDLGGGQYRVETIDSGFLGYTKSPVRSCSITSAKPPTRLATTGTPVAIPSKATIPNGS